MDFSSATIVVILGAVGGLITVSVPVLKIISDRVEAKKKEKIELIKLEQSNIANLRQIEAETDAERAERIAEREETELEFYKKRCKDCEDQLAESEKANLGSRTKRREINALLLKISRQIYAMEKGFEERYSIGEIKAIFIAIQKLFVELEDKMP